jgi:hypothetical protein
VFDRVQLADLYQMRSLYSSCGLMIRCNLRTVTKDVAKWLELKEKSPGFVISILEGFPDDFDQLTTKVCFWVRDISPSLFLFCH